LLSIGLGAGALSLLALPQAAFAQPMSEAHLYPQMTTHQIGSTNGSNGDTNPYGLAVIPKTLGSLTAGDLLVTDFNSASSMGQGTSLVEVNPATGASKVFYQNAAITGPVGIAINPSADIVWVTYYGTATNGSASGYAVISNTGTLLANYTNTTSSYNGNHDLFEGAWGAAFAPGAFFWSNAGAATPNATGTTGQVWRLNPNPTATTKNGQPINATYVPLATNLPTADMAVSTPTPSNVAGPQGMAYDAANGTLYVTDDYNNAIYALPNALTATGPVTPMMIAQNGALSAPQGIAINPVNNTLLVVNGASNNELVELTTSGRTLATRTLDTGTAGALFGLATSSMSHGRLGVYFDDSNTSTLDELNAPTYGYQSYQLAQADGATTAFGVPSMPAAPKVMGKVVGMAYAAGSNASGYWEVTANGSVYAAGSAHNYGGLNGTKLAAPIVGIASTPDGKGYWLVGADGGVFNFGDAGFYGNTYSDGLTGLMGKHPLTSPIVGIASTPDGKGYWLVGADGGVFNFGDAGFYGNTYSDGLTGLMGKHPLNMPVLGIIATPDGAGYWLVAKDGGVFNFGDAGFAGSGAHLGMTFVAAAGPLQ
jgi:sugar lactone lactonase YvrE